MKVIEYIERIRQFSGASRYQDLLDFADQHILDVEDEFTSEVIRILRIHLHHADIITSTLPQK